MPKLYFSGGNLKVPEGGQVHVQYSYGAVFKSGETVREGLADAINEGRLALDAIITHMQNQGLSGVNDNFKRWATRYMLVDNAGPSQEEFNTILAVLKLTNAGVNNAGLSIKVYSSKGSSRGYVTTYFGNSAASKSHRTPGMYNPGEGDMKSGVKGDIHMSVGGIKAKQLISAKLFVHEATHKFANTADFGEKGYTNDGTGAFRESGLTKEQALMNADSYGRLAVHFYRGENNMAQW